MKKITCFVGLVVIVILSIILIVLICNDFMQKVNVIYNFKEDNHVLCKGEYFTTEERELLNDTLSSNHEVLLLFTDENSLTDDNDISNIISNYTKKENVPYVVFKYSNDTKTLSSISSENVEFDDIDLKNVDYSCVYKYIPLAKSLNIILYAKQNILETIFSIFSLLVILLISCFIVFDLYELIKWNKDYGLLYKLSFMENKLKIKIDEDNKESIVKKIEYNAVGKQSKDYIMINLYDTIKITFDNGDYINLKYMPFLHLDVGILAWQSVRNLTFKDCLNRK